MPTSPDSYVHQHTPLPSNPHLWRYSNNYSTPTTTTGHDRQHLLVVEAVRAAKQQQLLVAAVCGLEWADGVTADDTCLRCITPNVC